MSISQSSTIPILAGGYITLDTIQKKTIISNRQCKIISTIGPSCWDIKQLESLMNNGTNTTLLDMSHGDKTIHIGIIERIKQARTNVNRNIGKLTITKSRYLLFVFCHTSCFVSSCIFCLFVCSNVVVTY